MLSSLQSDDPLKRVWGFHVHQEVPEEDLGRALLLQRACKQFLHDRCSVTVDHSDVMRRGYGPHLLPMWELRVESIADRREVAKHLGAAIAFCAINRGPLPAYIHPTMHDVSLPAVDQLRQEGNLNQKEAIWFGAKVEQRQSFFFEPPLEPDGRVVDTRTSRIIPRSELDDLIQQAEEAVAGSSSSCPTDDPFQKVIRGFHIHVDFLPKESAEGHKVFDRFVPYLLSVGLRPSSTRIYEAMENGPHVQQGWEVKFEYRDTALTLDALGVCMAWLMCNRQGFPVFAHLVTWEEGDIAEELLAHKQYAFFVDRLPPLDLSFFEKKLPPPVV